MPISSRLDNGNIDVISDLPHDIRLKIRGDNHKPEFFQWFNFDFEYDETPKAELSPRYILNIENADKVKYPGWNHYTPYKAYASYGDNKWFTVPTTYDKKTGKLTINFEPKPGTKTAQFAFFPPYDYARHLKLIESATNIPHCEITTLGKTNGEDGRDITMLTFGTPSTDKKEIVIIARQHPGEPQAEWYAERLIQLLKEHPELCDKYTFRIVPNMNPDGTYLGNLRTNKEGMDLNRMWQNPSMEHSPEVFLVLNKLIEIGRIDLFIDVHSDEVIPKPFLDEAHLSCPSATRNTRLQKLERLFMNTYIKGSRYMQNYFNYGKKERDNPINLTLAAIHVGERFNCPALTLEMPTKKWSWEKSQELADELLNVLPKYFMEVEKLDQQYINHQKFKQTPTHAFFKPISKEALWKSKSHFYGYFQNATGQRFEIARVNHNTQYAYYDPTIQQQVLVYKQKDGSFSTGNGKDTMELTPCSSNVALPS